MKIWYQSCSSVGIDPRWKWKEDFMARYFPKVARPDTKVDWHGLKVFAPKVIDYRCFQLLHAKQLLEAAIRAEQEGYDAFCVLVVMDFGFPEIKTAVDIPVLFTSETALHVACLLAPKFALVSPSEGMLRLTEEKVRLYGLESRAVPGVYFADARPLDVMDMIKNPKPLIQAFTQASRTVIKQGAGILVPGMVTISEFLVDQGVTEIDGVPILDIHGTMIKMAELMVDLKKIGMSRSKAGLYATPSKEELAQTLKLYAAK